MCFLFGRLSPGTPVEDIYKGNVMELFCWAIYAKDTQYLTKDETETLDWAVSGGL